MGSSSSSDSGNDKTVTIDKDIQVPANSLTKSMAEEKAAKDYAAALANSSGWERFSLGMKHGWKNQLGTKGPKAGDWDAARGRTLGYNDFLPGGIYGPMAGEKKGGTINFGARRDAWNAQNPDISDGRVARARSATLDRAFNQDHLQSLGNGLTVERQSADHSLAMSAANAETVGKLSELPDKPAQAEQDDDAMGGKPQAEAPIAAPISEPATAKKATGPITQKAPPPDDPTKAPVVSPQAIGWAEIAENQAEKDKEAKAKAKVQEQKQALLEAGIKGFAGQVKAAQKSAQKAARSREHHPAYGLTDAGRKSVIAKEHHPAYGYTNLGREMLSELKADIKQSLAPKTGFTPRGQQLVSLYNSLPGTKAVSSRDGLLAARMTGQNKRNRDRVLFGPDYKAVLAAEKEKKAQMAKQAQAARHRRGRNVEVNPYLGAIWQAEVRPTLVAGMAAAKAARKTPFSKDFLAHQSRIANVSVPNRYANTPAANVVRNAGWAFSKAVGSVPGVMESAGKRDLSLAQQGASPSHRQNAAIARGVVDLVSNTALKSNVGAVQEAMKKSGRHLPSFSYDLLESGIVSAKDYVLDALLEDNDKRGEEKK